ncbi:MAG: CRTAC1 family protein [Acidobacteriota bacterium]|nr:CRTAC1 family protein [Acidobacteriota bacterium]
MTRFVSVLFFVATLGLVTLSVTAATSVVFTDITDAVGLRFVHNNGAFGSKYMPETFGAGVIWLDVDADGWQDVLLVNGTAWPERQETMTYATLYRNDGDGTFTDISRGSGLDVPLYGMGGTAADFDNDGHLDVYLTALGTNRLFKGAGDGTFTDVTESAGVGDPGFSTGALWFDYDKDGHLDLFVGNYVEWTPETDLFCPSVTGGDNKAYCTPESYQGQSGTLYRGRGDGTFEDVTTTAGMRAPAAKALGVAVLDHNDDGWLDLFVANDLQPDQLFENRGDGTFEDIGVLAGVAFRDAGVARAGMGVDAIDYDGSGRADLVIGHFATEMMGLFHNEGNGLFIDEGPRSAIGRATLLTLTFGCFFFDFDLDGWPDIFAANGHLDEDVERIRSRVTYAQRPQLFHNLGQGRFEEVVAADDTALGTPQVARGAAYADMDNDGDLDVLVTANGGRARLLRNDGGNDNHWLRIQTIGTSSNRNGIGARIEVETADTTRSQFVKTGSSYLSQSQLGPTFGLGANTQADTVRITWPGGTVDTLGPVEVDQTIVVEEGTGLVDTIRFD